MITHTIVLQGTRHNIIRAAAKGRVWTHVLSSPVEGARAVQRQLKRRHMSRLLIIRITIEPSDMRPFSSRFLSLFDVNRENKPLSCVL